MICLGCRRSTTSNESEFLFAIALPDSLSESSTRACVSACRSQLRTHAAVCSSNSLVSSCLLDIKPTPASGSLCALSVLAGERPLKSGAGFANVITLTCRCKGRSGFCSYSKKPHIQLQGKSEAGPNWTTIASAYPPRLCHFIARMMASASLDRVIADPDILWSSKKSKPKTLLD